MEEREYGAGKSALLCAGKHPRGFNRVCGMFADSTRVKILYALFESELCVCDIAKVLNLTQSAVSHQLRILKSGKLVKYRRDGKTVFYSLADDHVRSIIDQGMDHISE